GCGTAGWCGAGHARPCGPGTPTAPPSWRPCAGCWPACPTTRRRCLWTRSRCTPTPRAAPPGCGGGRQPPAPPPAPPERRCLAGSIHWRTGRVFLTEGLPKEGRSAALFCRHLDDLRRALRHYKVIHVVCDNANTHKAEKSRLVKAYLEAWGHRVVLHYLPTYAPECNPIERVWWRLHEAVTRNHRCASMDELLALTFDWLESRKGF